MKPTWAAPLLFVVTAFFTFSQAQTPAAKKSVKAGRNAFITTTTSSQSKTVVTQPAQSYTAPGTPGSANSAPATLPASATNNSGQPAVGTSTLAAPAPAAAPPRSPWRLVYFGEYVGPRLSNIDLARTQGPQDAVAGYTGLGHSLKLGYQVAPNHILGAQVRASSPFDPTAMFFFKNLRFYGTWANMIDTKDVNVGTVVDLEIPNSTGARQNGNAFNLNFKINWELKTQLRNWSFTAMTLFRTMFYDRSAGQSDFYLGLFPWVTMDLAPNWQLVFEGSFDASHSYNDVFFQLGQADPDYVNVGVMHSFSPHFQINPAFRFFTDNISFKAAVIYTSITASL
jgi:hypothetical protein